MISMKTISSLTAVLLLGVSGVALAQTPAPAQTPPAAAPTAPAAPAASAPAAPAPAAKAAAPAGSGSGSAAAPAAKQVDPAMAKFWTTCKADVEKYCADAAAQRKAAAGAGSGSGSGSGSAAATPVPKGKGRGQVVACLNTNLANLTPECKTAFEERKAAAKAKKG